MRGSGPRSIPVSSLSSNGTSRFTKARVQEDNRTGLAALLSLKFSFAHWARAVKVIISL